MALPIFHSEDRNFQMMQTQWASQLNPVIAKPQVQSSILKNVTLTSGTNTINHLLGRPLQGWKIVRQRGPASIYDLQDTNQMPNLTLVLNSSAGVVVDIEVF